MPPRATLTPRSHRSWWSQTASQFPESPATISFWKRLHRNKSSGWQVDHMSLSFVALHTIYIRTSIVSESKNTLTVVLSPCNLSVCEIEKHIVVPPPLSLVSALSMVRGSLVRVVTSRFSGARVLIPEPLGGRQKL